MAVRLQFVPISFSLIQFCLLPPIFFSSEGGSFIFRISRQDRAICKARSHALLPRRVAHRSAAGRRRLPGARIRLSRGAGWSSLVPPRAHGPSLLPVVLTGFENIAPGFEEQCG